MRIGGPGRRAQPRHGSRFDAAIGGEAGAPFIPQTGFAQSELAIRFNAFVVLAFDGFFPGFSGILGSPNRIS